MCIRDSSRSVKTILNETAGLTTSVLLETSEESYSRADYLEDSDLYTKKDTDVDGPFALAAVAEKPLDATSGKTARIMLFGNDFLMGSNSTIGDLLGFANNNMVLNAANWMQDKKDSIAIKSKTYMTDYITLDAQNASIPVSYTHLDVYKRQMKTCARTVSRSLPRLIWKCPLWIRTMSFQSTRDLSRNSLSRSLG